MQYDFSLEELVFVELKIGNIASMTVGGCRYKIDNKEGAFNGTYSADLGDPHGGSGSEASPLEKAMGIHLILTPNVEVQDDDSFPPEPGNIVIIPIGPGVVFEFKP